MKITCIFTSFLAAFMLMACSDPVIPLPEHPRPDFERPQWLNLNGYWSFTFDEALASTALAQNNISALDRRILVPFSWGSKLSEVPDSTELVGWYGRQINVPKEWKGKRVFLIIGASDWETTVWMNGREMGRHQGGYTPFECELTDVKFGDPQQLIIKADDSPGEGWVEGNPFGHPKQSVHLYAKQEYGEVHGIWQTVYLEARGENFIRSLHFSPDVDNSQVKVDVTLDTPAAQGTTFRLDFKTGNQKPFTTDIGGKDHASFTIPLTDQHLWSLDDPFLYEVTASLADEDHVDSYFGQRKVGVAKLPGTDYSYVALNNKPVYLQLCLDQSYHPDGYYTFPSDEAMKNEIMISKRLGLSGNRIHIKVEVPRKLYWADRLGLLIMADTPNYWGDPLPQARQDWEHCLRGQVERDYNHPSIFAWVNFNETWGLFDRQGIYQKDTQEWVRQMYRLTKTLDPTRLVEDMSPCRQDHVETDLNTWHSYRPGWDWEREIKFYCDNTFPGSTFNFVEGSVQGEQPMFNSECGNVWGYEGSTGDVDFTWDYHIMTDVFRRYPKCAGWLYTEHHDVIKEWNGYVKADRSEKIDGLDDLVPGMTMADFHSLYYISPNYPLYSEVQGGAQLMIPLYASFMTDQDPGQLLLETELVGWNQLGELHTFQTDRCEMDFVPYMSCIADSLLLEMPEEKGLYLLRLILKSGNKVLHRNFTTFRIKEGQDLTKEKMRLVSFPPASFTASEWSQKQNVVFDGLKVNGMGSGYFEYQIQLPEDIDMQSVKSARLIFEASSRKFYTRDEKEEPDYSFNPINTDSGKPGNAYPMTDTMLWPSVVEVAINGTTIGRHTLNDDPADHRGILSWAAQPRNSRLSEAGTYGELVSLEIPPKIFGMEHMLTIRFSVPKEQAAGGLAVYGKDFGRYPLDPTVEITLKR